MTVPYTVFVKSSVLARRLSSLIFLVLVSKITYTFFY